MADILHCFTYRGT